ncbi:MAG TPA: MFS transporter [Anaerolineales bacterium]|nr:MFS transporter [Anaerolineales bacterium]
MSQTSQKYRRIFILLPLTLFLLFVPSVPALAHGGEGEPSPMAGPLAWGFMGFGIFTILAVSAVLLTGSPRQVSASGVRAAYQQTGLRGYLAKMRYFSRNARLYMVHVVGMDVIYGSWAVLFNLYLLAVGYDIEFIGLRILLGSLASGLTALPAGMISDRIGRKLSFVLGDGMGALMSLIAISTTNEPLLLVTAVVGGVFSSLHGVAEPAFMAENSENYERVHLFSVSSGTRTAAAIIGSALAGLVPLLLATAEGANTIGLYRGVAYLGIGGWFASLIPAVMLQQVMDRRPAAGLDFGRLFANVRHPRLIFKLTLPEVLVGFGAGFALPLMNVFFKSGVGSEEIEIGAVFAAGQAFLVVGSFLAPFVAARLGKVNSVLLTRAASIPFILLMGFSIDLGSGLSSVLSIAGLAYIARITLMNMASPVRSAFAMEILDPGERGTQVGLEQALWSGLSGVAGYLGARMMDAGDFTSPFLLMAGLYLLAVIVFWRFFAGQESELSAQAAG